MTSRYELNKILTLLYGVPKFRQIWIPKTNWDDFEAGRSYVSCQIQHRKSTYFIVARWLTPWPEHARVNSQHPNKRSLVLTISASLPETIELRWLDVEVEHRLRGLFSTIRELRRRNGGKHP